MSERPSLWSFVWTVVLRTLVLGLDAKRCDESSEPVARTGPFLVLSASLHSEREGRSEATPRALLLVLSLNKCDSPAGLLAAKVRTIQKK